VNRRSWLLLPLVIFLLVAATPQSAPGKQVVCVLCGDYTFDEKDAVKAQFQGREIHLCSSNELALLQKRPATDPVNGHRVNKIQTLYTVDRKVQVQKNGKLELWPRRFFFESESTRAAFLKNPRRFTREPYAER